MIIRAGTGIFTLKTLIKNHHLSSVLINVFMPPHHLYHLALISESKTGNMKK